ncbi:Fucose isomerase [uncultured Pleomorphomonas sp.]|uniref:Fucose isomerase n=1 Tax=uncultured Pleomorphomonas sp. TaxID=442121 RepID=A0A212LJ04_9HYPH|nr:fucose isomerase [uncultured Pleomorphomonas sp.]SCM77490.1 Fucose isomerase [uncultured Pleomorphomonas sp.]
MTDKFKRDVTLGLVVGSRQFFNGAPCIKARDDLEAQARRLGIRTLMPPVDATVNGAVQTRDDAKLYGRFFAAHKDEIDGLVISLANFGDEIAIIEMVMAAGLGVPILLQACNDEFDKVDVKSRRDAFCGKISVANNFYNYGVPFTETTSHTSDLDGEEFAGDLDTFSRVCRTVRGLRHARIGAIGARTAPFQTMRYSEKLLQAIGVTVVPVDLSEIIGRAKAIGDDAASVKDKLAAIGGYGKIDAHIRPEQVLKQAKWGIAVDAWMAENDCDASAIQCWRSLQDNYGCATCLSMSMMGEKLMPSACEVDVLGTLSMYALTLAAGQPAAILDWNNNYGYDPDKCVGTHCGNYPKSFFGDTPNIGELDVLGETIGRDKCFGAVKGKVKAGPMSFLRFSSDDLNATLKAYVGDGDFTDDPYGMDGGIAVIQVEKLRQLLKVVTQNGFEHHVAMVRGHVAGIVEEAVSRYLKLPIYHHNGEAVPTLGLKAFC